MWPISGRDRLNRWWVRSWRGAIDRTPTPATSTSDAIPYEAWTSAKKEETYDANSDPHRKGEAKSIKTARLSRASGGWVVIWVVG